MFKFKILILIFILPLSSQCFAYNWDNCNKVFFSGNGVGIFLSTTSYVSSTRECSMLGQIEDQKKYFIAQNLDSLIIDSARGNGEYLYAYAELSRCHGDAKKEYSVFLQRNFTTIYGGELENSPEQVYERLEMLLKNNPSFSIKCGVVI